MSKSMHLLIVILIVIAGVFGVCVGFGYLMYGNSEVICFGTPFPSTSDVEHYAYFKFPPTAGDIEYHANGVNRKAGCAIWAKFDMDSKDFDTFKSTTYVANLSSSTRLTGNGFEFFAEEQGWQQPSAGLAGHSNPLPGASGFPTVYEDQWIFINTSDPQKWTVFVIVNKEWI